jgi:hypothetical protein
VDRRAATGWLSGSFPQMTDPPMMPSGPIFLFPIQVDRPMTGNTVVVGFHGGQLFAAGYAGELEGGEPAMLVIYEGRVEDWSLARLSKSTIGQMIFSRFASVHETGMGRDQAYGKVEAADSRRRDAVSRLRRVESAIAAHGGDFARLSGWTILLWEDLLAAPDFGDGQAERIAEHLAQLDPTTQIVEHSGPRLPENIDLPDLAIPSARANALPLPPGTLPITTRFASRQGFELGLGQSPTVSLSELHDKIRQTVARKDLAGNDELLITCGAPDGTGFLWPAESMTFEFLRRHGLPTVSTTHLRRVYLYSWEDGYLEVPTQA